MYKFVSTKTPSSEILKLRQQGYIVQFILDETVVNDIVLSQDKNKAVVHFDTHSTILTAIDGGVMQWVDLLLNQLNRG